VYILTAAFEIASTQERENGIQFELSFVRKIGKRKSNSQALAAGDWLVTGPPILPKIEVVTKICFFPSLFSFKRGRKALTVLITPKRLVFKL